MDWEGLHRVGERIEAAWRARHFDAGAFPDLALAELASAQLEPSLDFGSVIRRVLNAETALLQEPDFGFSDLPLVAFHGAFFRLQVLVWTSGSMAVHQHPFAGAFRVLAGSSISARFALETQLRLSSQLALVRARTEHLELLELGDARPIHPGEQLTHAVYHCALPSVTVVARSHHVPWTTQDNVLFRPGVLLDARLESDPTLRMLDRALSVVANAEPARFAARVSQALAELDVARATWLVRRFAARLGDDAETTLEPLRAREPELARALLAAVQDAQARALIREARRLTSEPAVRFLLAAMSIATTREDVCALLARSEYAATGAESAAAHAEAILERAPPMVLYAWTRLLR